MEDSMQIAIRWGLALLLLAPVTFAQGEKAAAETALQTAKDAEIAVEKAEEVAAKDKENAALQTAVTDAKATYETALDELTTKADAYGDKDGDITVYNEFLISAGRPRMDAKAAFGLVQKWTIQGKDWLVENGPGVAIKIVVFLLILLVKLMVEQGGGGLGANVLGNPIHPHAHLYGAAGGGGAFLMLWAWDHLRHR
jgi:hypothetical protein